MRVFELAKQLGITSKDLISDLKGIGVTVSNHMAALKDDTVSKILAKAAGKAKKPAAAALVKPPKTVEAAKPARERDHTAALKAKKTPPPIVEPPKAEKKMILVKRRPSETSVVGDVAPLQPVEEPAAISVGPADLFKVAAPPSPSPVHAKPSSHPPRPGAVEPTIAGPPGSPASLPPQVTLPPDAAPLVAESFGVKVEMTAERLAETLLQEPEETEDARVPRPPVVTIMGHVDHGKTSLLDAIRQTRVTEGEAGGITQHIGAYVVHVHGKSITFLDTPGHEAFTAMRARGARVTDLVVLVVAADDGVMPQTIEAIDHERAAGVPLIVAINKMDKPDANPDRVKNSLAERGLVPEAWGGDTIYVEVSAKKKTGLDTLLEMILLQAEVLELRANPARLAKGTVIEAKLDRGRGPVATVLVQTGTLRAGDPFVVGTFSGRVRALFDDAGRSVKEAGPSIPAEVVGLLGVPMAGDEFVVTRDERIAREIAESRLEKQRTAGAAPVRKVTLDDLFAQVTEGTVKDLGIIIRADVQGSAEAIADAVERLGTEAVKPHVLLKGVGGITENEVQLAAASNAIIIGFNVRPEAKAAALAEREGVDIRTYSIIYEVLNDIKAAMEGLLEPTLKERVLGRAEVRQVFMVTKVGAVAGCYVTDGTIVRAGASVRVVRDGVVVYEGRLASLRRFKDDVKEVQAGYECGITVENFNDVKPGFRVEVFTVDKVAAKL